MCCFEFSFCFENDGQDIEDDQAYDKNAEDPAGLVAFLPPLDDFVNPLAGGLFHDNLGFGFNEPTFPFRVEFLSRKGQGLEGRTRILILHDCGGIACRFKRQTRTLFHRSRECGSG